MIIPGANHYPVAKLSACSITFFSKKIYQVLLVAVVFCSMFPWLSIMFQKEFISRFIIILTNSYVNQQASLRELLFWTTGDMFIVWHWLRGCSVTESTLREYSYYLLWWFIDIRLCNKFMIMLIYNELRASCSHSCPPEPK